jgi:hypothetical protein
VCLVRVLFDGMFAARVRALGSPGTFPDNAAHGASIERAPAPPPLASSPTPALQLLALFQREGRLIDFLMQDIAPFSDGDVGVVARTVHEGCRRALASHARIDPIRNEPEGGVLELPSGFDTAEVKLSGNVQGAAPYRGVLRHRGWRVSEVTLPVPLAGHNPSVLAPAEVEL